MVFGGVSSGGQSRMGWSSSVPNGIWFTSDGMERFQQENIPPDSGKSSSQKKGEQAQPDSTSSHPRQPSLASLSSMASVGPPFKLTPFW